MYENYISTMLLKIPPLLLALTFHEWAHGQAAMRLGDKTAYMLGRLTLNPIKHLDLVGSLVFLASGIFGWAKPVPVNPRNFRNPSHGMMQVSLAGPMANILLAIVFAVIYKLLVSSGLAVKMQYSTIGSPILVMIYFSIFLNVALAVFNIIPIPPLDGSKVLMHYLPSNMAMSYARFERYGFMVLMFLVITGVIGKVVLPFIILIVNLLI